MDDIIQNAEKPEKIQPRMVEKLPKNLFLLPLRNGILFPGVLSPITITNKRDLEIIKAAEPRGEVGLVLLKDELPDDSELDPFNHMPDAREIDMLIDAFQSGLSDEQIEDLIALKNNEENPDNNRETTLLNMLRKQRKGPKDEERFFKVGVYARILRKINLPNGGVSLFLTTVRRFHVDRFFSTGTQFIATVSFYSDEFGDSKFDPQLKAYTRLLHTDIKKIGQHSPIFTDDVKVNIANIESPGRLADYVANNLDISAIEQQEILETIDISTRVEKILKLLQKERAVLEIQTRIENQVKAKVDMRQKEFFLREELKNIQDELDSLSAMNGGNPFAKPTTKKNKIARLRELFMRTPLNEEASEAVASEFERLEIMEPMAHDYSLTIQYIETVLQLPWAPAKPEKFSIEKAKQILDKDHYGLEDVKQRIMEFIAVRKLKNDTKGSIICLVGPPGVGKTSIGLSIARALGKKCFRFSVGGIRDEAEIKGHRRTYVGALPGKIIQGLKVVKTNDPVFLIDEIDKLQGASNQGDPAAALLEVLDPEQNSTFRDHYLNVPFDISNILFIVTANDKKMIPAPLLDRMEVIEISGYTSQEKLEIAKNYLVPKNRKNNGLKASTIKISDSMLSYIAEGWAREPGVRNLEKALSRIYRKVALESFDKENFKSPVKITTSNIQKYLDMPIYTEDDIVRADKVGMSIGLAYNGIGGATLAIEAIAVPKAKEELKLTGSLGDVMKESASIAFSYLKSNAQRLGLDPSFFENNSVHLHFPDGATPKDGPSAGAAICCALYSLISQKLICRDLTMTGELSLTGRVMPIGGLKEKTLAVQRNNFKQVIISKSNLKDLNKLEAQVKQGLTYYIVTDINQVLNIAFTKDRIPPTEIEGVEVLQF